MHIMGLDLTNVLALFVLTLLSGASARQPFHLGPAKIYLVRYKGDVCAPHSNIIIGENFLGLGKCMSFKKDHAMDKIRFEMPDRQKLFDSRLNGPMHVCKLYFFEGHGCEGEVMDTFEEIDDTECLDVNNAHSVMARCVRGGKLWDDDEIHVNNTLDAKGEGRRRDVTSGSTSLSWRA